MEAPALGRKIGMEHLASIQQHRTRNARKLAARRYMVRQLDRGGPLVARATATPGRTHAKIVRPGCDHVGEDGHRGGSRRLPRVIPSSRRSLYDHLS